MKKPHCRKQLGLKLNARQIHANMKYLMEKVGAGDLAPVGISTLYIRAQHNDFPHLSSRQSPVVAPYLQMQNLIFLLNLSWFSLSTLLKQKRVNGGGRDGDWRDRGLFSNLHVRLYFLSSFCPYIIHKSHFISKKCMTKADSFIRSSVLFVPSPYFSIESQL